MYLNNTNKNQITSFLLTEYENGNTYLDYLKYLFEQYILVFLEENNIDYNYKTFFSEFISLIFHYTHMEDVQQYNQL